MKITKNICVSHWRRQKLKTDPLSGENYPTGEAASSATDRIDELRIKQMLFARLTRTERSYMMMKTDEGLSLNEITAITGKPKPGIKTALSKAKRKRIIIPCTSAAIAIFIAVGVIFTNSRRDVFPSDITTMEILETIGTLANSGADEISSITATPGTKGIVVEAKFSDGSSKKYLMKCGPSDSSIELTAQKTK